MGLGDLLAGAVDVLLPGATATGVNPYAANVIIPTDSAATKRFVALTDAVNKKWPRGTVEFSVVEAGQVANQAITAAQQASQLARAAAGDQSPVWAEQLRNLANSVDRQASALRGDLGRIAEAYAMKKPTVWIGDFKSHVMAVMLTATQVSRGVDYARANDLLSWVPSFVYTLGSAMEALGELILKLLNAIAKLPSLVNKALPIIAVGAVGIGGLWLYSKLRRR